MLVTEDKKETALENVKGLEIDQASSIVTVKPTFEKTLVFYALAKTDLGHMIWKEIKVTKKIPPPPPPKPTPPPAPEPEGEPEVAEPEPAKLTEEELEKVYNQTLKAAETMEDNLKNDIPLFE